MGLTLVVSCAQEVVTVTQEVPVEVTRQVEVEVTRVVTVEVEVTPEVMEPEEPLFAVPFESLWASSGHADASAEAFVHWDEDDPQVVPIACAKCHSTVGMLDYLGADGSEFGVVDNDQPIGTVVSCEACHNEVSVTLDSVIMPSGIEISGLGSEAICMQCHQGRHSTTSVNESLAAAGVEDDTISEDLGFLNIHYYAAAASKYGTAAKGGYEYEGNTYDANFAHVDNYDTCAECHNTHTLAVKVDECRACHADVTEVEDFKNVRMAGSLVDFDGDGDLSEGIYFEIEGLQTLLYEALQAYASDVAGTPIVYDSLAYPYFFIDDGNGVVDEGEAAYPNRYNAWTPRLVKAAYNFQVSKKDPGAYAHGGKYHLQLLYDSIEDLNAALSSPVDLSAAHRIDHGHFAGSEEAFRHWDEDDPAVVSGSCSKCHSAAGLPLFLTEGVTISQDPANGFQCATCHNDLETWTRYEVASVTFPSGAVIDSGDQNTNLCMNCHQGRTSKASVDGAIAGIADDTVDESLRFLNIHYFVAGATLFGTEVKGAYEYDGNEYLGRFEHVPNAATCTGCHNTHQLSVEYEKCGACHPGVASVEDLKGIRIATDDWDGDGDTTEGIYGEIATMRDQLYAAIQAYAGSTEGAAAIIYDSHSYPYFFIDTDENGVPDPSEANYGNRYGSWTPRLLQAAYNYQYSAKDPGGFAHNGKYVIQVLYDTLLDIGGDVSGMTRPSVSE
jgi:hypothetical protein